MVILDSRPMPEFNNMSIPGGVDCPGAELVYRVKDFAPNPNTLVVVNCAGRTRSIIGAQSLINAGLPNKVMALKNGTMGWHLAGLTVARGETRSFGPQGPEAAKFAQSAASTIAERMGIKKIDMAGLEALEAKGGPLYKLDVRDPPNTHRATSRASATPRADSSCRRPTNMSARAMPQSCCTTMTACAPP